MGAQSKPEPIPELKTITVPANDLEFEVLTCGPEDPSAPLALCLHGFPEINLSWREQMVALAALGYRVWAPNQRGYGKTTRPPHMQDYALENLLADVAALIDASAATRVVLLAHDWGAIVAWYFATRRIRPLERLVIINVPHPVPFSRAIKRFDQFRRSWYALAFQIPALPERFLARNGARAIAASLLDTSSSRATFPRDLIAATCANAAQPGALKAMIDWYRAYIRGGGRSRQFALGFPKIEVPTLLLWGEADQFLAKYTTDGTEEFVPNLTKVFLPGVSHWVQHDAADRCNQELRAFLQTS